MDGSVNIQYGVNLLIPVVLVQMTTLRKAMAFLPTQKIQQAILYEFEDAIEQLLYKVIPGKAAEILEMAQLLANVSYSHLTEQMDSRCFYLLETPVKDRLKILPQLLHSLHPFYNVHSLQSIPATKFVTGDIELPDFDW